MTTSTSLDFYLRFVGERHGELVRRIDAMLGALVTNDTDEKERSVGFAFQAANDLVGAIASSDRPDWLVQLQSYLNRPGNSYSYEAILKQLIPLLEPMKKHQWHAPAESNLAFNFDAIFERYRNQSRIPELFDHVIEVLEKMAASEEIDSRRVILALERLIATLQKNKKGSYFSMQGAWDFLVGLLRNFLMEELKKVPSLGSLIVALEKSIGELNKEMSVVHEQIAGELQTSLNSDFPFLTYSSKGTPMLSGPRHLKNISA